MVLFERGHDLMRDFHHCRSCNRDSPRVSCPARNVRKRVTVGLDALGATLATVFPLTRNTRPGTS